MPELVEKGEIENCHSFAYASLESRGLERAEQRLPLSVLPVLLGGKHISPPPDAGEEEWAVCLTAKTEVQLSGIILLKIQDKITANSLNCFLVRHFEIEVHFFGQKCDYCSHHIRI